MDGGNIMKWFNFTLIFKENIPKGKLIPVEIEVISDFGYDDVDNIVDDILEKIKTETNEDFVLSSIKGDFISKCHEENIWKKIPLNDSDKESYLVEVVYLLSNQEFINDEC